MTLFLMEESRNYTLDLPWGKESPVFKGSKMELKSQEPELKSYSITIASKINNTVIRSDDSTSFIETWNDHGLKRNEGYTEDLRYTVYALPACTCVEIYTCICNIFIGETGLLIKSTDCFSRPHGFSPSTHIAAPNHF